MSNTDRSFPHELVRLRDRLAALVASDLVGPFPDLRTIWMPAEPHYSPARVIDELDHHIQLAEDMFTHREPVELAALLAFADWPEEELQTDPIELQGELDGAGWDAHIDTEGRWWTSYRELWPGAPAVKYDVEEDGRHIASVEAIPGCLAYGRTRAEAHRKAFALAREPLVTDQRIRALMTEARHAGDDVQVALCKLALLIEPADGAPYTDTLAGTPWAGASVDLARAECERVILAARVRS